MRITVDKIKITVLLTVFFLFGLGRWVNLAQVHDWPASSALLIGISYGLLVALLAYFLTDLVLAKELLQFKAVWIKTVFFFIIIISFLNYFLFRRYPASLNRIAGIETIAIALFFVVVLALDKKKKHLENFIFSETNILPERYLSHHPIRTFLETFLRLFPYPEPVALYKIGNPSPKSPVFVTGNYDLTIRRTVAALKFLDCWLLVCDSRGIDIWSSSSAGHFKTEDIVKAVKLTNLPQKVSHKKLILPQLCAANIVLRQIKKETKFKAEFGPASIKNIAAYLQDRKNREIRRVTFTITEHLEMAVGCSLFLIVLLILVYNFINLSHLLIVVPIIFFLTIIHALIFPRRIIKGILPWSFFVGSIVFFITYGLFSAGMGIISLGNSIAIGIGMTYIVNEFSGWSPLLKYYPVPYQKAKITVNQELCTGCYRCIEVCPRGVFEFLEEKSRAADVDKCILCKACFKQCPSGAIIHSDNPATRSARNLPTY